MGLVLAKSAKTNGLSTPGSLARHLFEELVRPCLQRGPRPTMITSSPANPTSATRKFTSLQWCSNEYATSSNEGPVETPTIVVSLHDIGLWVTGILFVFTGAFGLLVPILGHLGMIRLAPEPDGSMPETWTWQSLPGLVIPALNLVGGTLLLYRRRIAVLLLFASGAIMALFLAYRILKGLYPTPATSPLAPYWVTLLWITAFACVYLLRRHGVLNR